MSFHSAKAAPPAAARRSAGSAPSHLPQGQGSGELLRGRVIPPPHLLHTRPLVCTRHSPVYTSVHPLSSRFASHNPVHTRTRAGLPPHATPFSFTPPQACTYSSPTEGTADPQQKETPMKGAREVVGSWGGAYRSRVPRCMLSNSLINFTAHNTPSPGGGSCADLFVPPGFAGRLERVLRAVSRRLGYRGRSASPFPGAPGPARPLTTCSLLLPAWHSRKRAASSSVSMLIAPESCRGRAGAETAAREPGTGQAGGAGRREDLASGGDRTGRRSALRREERGSTGRKINVSPRYLQNVTCKFLKI